MQTSARIPDGNGFFRVDRNPLSKTGVFSYRGSELPGAADPNKEYRVLRPPEELGSPETIASFRMIPVVDEHTWLGPNGGISTTDKGVHGVTGEGVEFDGTYLTAPLKIYRLPDEPKVELSSGYACEYDWTPGTWNGEFYDAVQRNIRGNHVAMVWEGRMGPDVRMLDHLPTIAFDTLEYVKMAENASPTVEQLAAQLAELMPVIEQVKQLQEALAAAQTPPEAQAAAAEAEEVAGEVAEAANEVEVAAAAVEAVPSEEEAAPVMDKLDEKEKALDASMKKLAALKVATPKGLDAAMKAGTARSNAVKARSGVKTKGLDARVKGLESTAGDSAVAAIAKRDALANRLHSVVGVFDHKPMNHAQVVAYGAEKLELPAGTSADTLDAYLKGRESVQATPARAGDAAPPSAGAVADYIKKNQER